MKNHSGSIKPFESLITKIKGKSSVELLGKFYENLGNLGKRQHIVIVSTILPKEHLTVPVKSRQTFK